MTEDDKDRIIGQVVRELAETKRTLACLQAKAEGQAQALYLLGNWLRGLERTKAHLPNDLSIEGARQLLNEIDETKARIEGLEARRAELGV